MLGGSDADGAAFSLKSYVELLIQTCHRRGIAHARWAAWRRRFLSRTTPVANEQALEKVRLDKLREVRAGHDGTWVAHPGLVPIAKQIFDDGMPAPNQISKERDEVHISAKDLLAANGEGTITVSRGCVGISTSGCSI